MGGGQVGDGHDRGGDGTVGAVPVRLQRHRRFSSTSAGVYVPGGSHRLHAQPLGADAHDRRRTPGAEHRSDDPPLGVQRRQCPWCGDGGTGADLGLRPARSALRRRYRRRGWFIDRPVRLETVTRAPTGRRLTGFGVTPPTALASGASVEASRPTQRGTWRWSGAVSGAGLASVRRGAHAVGAWWRRTAAGTASTAKNRSRAAEFFPKSLFPRSPFPYLVSSPASFVMARCN